MIFFYYSTIVIEISKNFRIHGHVAQAFWLQVAGQVL
jgi:hypothetical protein